MEKYASLSLNAREHALSSIGRAVRDSPSRWISQGISNAGRVHTIKWSSNLCIENSKNRTTFRVPLNELVAQPTSINFADSKVISSDQVNKHTDTFDTCTYESNHWTICWRAIDCGILFPFFPRCMIVFERKKFGHNDRFFFATKNRTKIKSLKEWIGNAPLLWSMLLSLHGSCKKETGRWVSKNFSRILDWRESFKST